jgi:hypothetical protein
MRRSAAPLCEERSPTSGPGLPAPVGRSTSPPTSFGPLRGVGRGLALLDVWAKKFGSRTFWRNLALRLPVRAEVRTVCRGYHGFLCGLPRYCRSDLAASGQFMPWLMLSARIMEVPPGIEAVSVMAAHYSAPLLLNIWQAAQRWSSSAAPVMHQPLFARRWCECGMRRKDLPSIQIQVGIIRRANPPRGRNAKPTGLTSRRAAGKGEVDVGS